MDRSAGADAGHDVPAGTVATVRGSSDTSAASGRERQRWLGIGAAAGAAVIFGTSYPATAVALGSFDPLAASAWRGMASLLLVLAASVVGGLASLLAGRRRGLARGAAGAASNAPPAPRADGARRATVARLAVLGILGGPGFILAMNVAVGFAGPSVTAFVTGLYALLAAVIARPILGEPLERRTAVALLVALAGTVFLAEIRSSSEVAAGVAIALAAALSFAAYLVLSRRWSRTWPITARSVTIANVAATGPGLVGVALLVDPVSLQPSRVDPAALAAIAWLAIGPGILAQLLVVAGVRRLDARRASAFLLLNPLAAAVSSALLLGESLAPLQLAGAALTLLGMAAASGLRPGRARASTTRATRR